MSDLWGIGSLIEQDVPRQRASLVRRILAYLLPTRRRAPDERDQGAPLRRLIIE